MSGWKHYMREGNSAISGGQYDLARVLYRRAMQIIVSDYETIKARDPYGAIAAMTVSRLNLAEVESQLGDYAAASLQYVAATEFLSEALNAGVGGQPARAAILEAGSQITKNWLRFLRQHLNDLPPLELKAWERCEPILKDGLAKRVSHLCA